MGKKEKANGKENEGKYKIMTEKVVGVVEDAEGKTRNPFQFHLLMD